MVTAKDGSEDVVEALDAGANDYMTKPVDFAVAQARIRTQLTARRADPLTGLPNRLLFMERLNELIARSRAAGAFEFAVFFLDVDRFKIINDSLGHAAGDELLTGISRRLEQSLRSTDTVATIRRRVHPCAARRRRVHGAPGRRPRRRRRPHDRRAAGECRRQTVRARRPRGRGLAQRRRRHGRTHGINGPKTWCAMRTPRCIARRIEARPVARSSTRRCSQRRKSDSSSNRICGGRSSGRSFSSTISRS